MATTDGLGTNLAENSHWTTAGTPGEINFGSIGNATAGHFVRDLLDHAMPVLILERFAMSYTLPMNETKIIQWRRSLPFPPATEPLNEGQTPPSSHFGYDTVSAAIELYGDWAEITDVVADTSKDQVLRDMAERQGEQIAETRELLMWDVLRAGTNVGYGSGATNRGSVTKTSVLNSSLQRTQTTVLQRLKAKMITKVLSSSAEYATYSVEAAYVAVGHTNLDSTVRDLSAGSNANHNQVFTPTSRYGANTGVASEYEVGSYEKVRYILSPDLPPHQGAGADIASGDKAMFYWSENAAGADKYDVYPIVFIGRNAFGCIALRGSRTSQGKVTGVPVRPSVLQPGVPRSGDPIGQRGSIGWKMWFACLILNECWLRRVEVACAK